MPIEYQPLTSLTASRAKINTAAAFQVEISEQELFEAACDVLASRGGERWRNLDELLLATRPDVIRMAVGWRGETEDSNEFIFINTLQRDHNNAEYRITRRTWQGRPDDPIYELYELETIDENGLFEATGSNLLASARLYGLLANAHMATRKEKLGKDAYSPA